MTSSAPNPDDRLRLLVIEDDPIFQKIIQRYLYQSSSSHRPRVTVCGTLSAGLCELKGEAVVDAVLLDLTLPDSEGLETLRRLQEEAPSRPVIVLTGLDDELVAAEAVRQGAQDFLVKSDLSASILLRSVRYAIERTKSRQLEQQLYQSQKMETLGRLAGGVAHDFNNILTVIIACCEVLTQERQATGLPPHPQISEIEQAADRAASLTRQLLAVSRRHVAQPTVIDLNQVVRQTEEMLRRLIGEQVEVVVELDPQLPAIRADRAQIEQILVNLVVNARDAMPEGGRLAIATRGLGSRDSRCELMVQDDGIGMDRATLDKIFEPFFTTKEPGQGTGLGLSIVDSLVKQSGGEILIESEPNRGAIFRVRFPTTEESPVPPAVVTGVTDDSERSGTVLLVEDEAMVRDVVVTLLTPWGFEVESAANVAEAWEHLERDGGRYDVVLTDVVLPDKSGFELAQELRRRFPDLPVLFMSGYTDTASDQRCLETGAHFLQKPFSPRELLAKLDEALSCASAARHQG